MVGEVKHHVSARLVKKWFRSVRLSPENVVKKELKKRPAIVMKRPAIVMKRLGNAMKKLDNVIETSVQPIVGAESERTAIAAVLRMLEARPLRH
jgi:hypothetical protein